MAMKKISRAAVLAIVALGLVLTVTTAGLLSVSQTVSTTGTVTTVNVGCYSDGACTQVLTEINWGSISPGNSVTKTVYVKNTGNVPITLSLTKNNWYPPGLDADVTITWDREGASLAAGASVAAAVTLSVSSGITGVSGFGVNIVITGTG